MTNDITYNGFTANPSDYECGEGDLAASIGLVPEDGALKPILPPTVILTLSAGEKVMFIHKTSTFSHFIVYNNSTISSIDRDTSARLEIGTIASVTHFNSVGNTLLVFSPAGINYYLWKDGAYNSLGTQLPDIEVSFGLIGHPRLYSLSDDSESTFTISFDGISEEDIYNEFSEDNKTKITSQVMAKVNKFIANETVNKGRFCFPFFVRYALKLYDGSLVCHSAPILMNPSTVTCPQVIWKRVTGKGSYTDAELDIMLVASTLDYRFIRNSDFYTIDRWKDIVKSVEVYISKPIYTYDQDGECSSFSDTDNFNSKFIGKLYADNPTTTTTTPEEDKLLGLFTDKNFLDIYAEWEYSKIYGMYFSANRSYPSTTLHLPEFTEGKVRETIENTNLYYKLCSIYLDDAVTASKAGERTEIVVNDEYLQSLVNRESMTDDYLTHDKLYADYSFGYNSRINLAGVQRKPFNGFLAQSMFAYCTTNDVSWELNKDTKELTITGNTYGNDGYQVAVYIKENNEDYMVQAETLYYDMCRISTFLSTTVTTKKYDEEGNVISETTGLNKRSWGCWFFYPNTNAYKMVIYNYSSSCYVVELQAHEFLNGAYALIDYELQRENNITSLPSITTEDETIIQPNKIYTSEVNNPFYFPLSGINTVGTGTILGICAAAKALSQGQFGQFPLYAFSSEGIWALEVSDTGTYSAKQPISRDVCINTDSITQIDSSVLFATDRGIMLISGSEVQCLSDKINSVDLFTIADLPNPDALVSTFNNRADDSEVVTLDDITFMSFNEFLSACRMIYDYTNQRIIVYNSSVRYAYVYSMKSQSWGMMLSDLQDSVNSYPEALAMTTTSVSQTSDDGTVTESTVPVLVNMSIPSADKVTALLLTRPFKIGEPNVFKTINTIIQRGYFAKDHVAQVLYGSNDLFNWHTVWSSKDKYLRGFRGTPYKAYRLAIICQFDKAESLFGFTVSYEPRRLNQPR
ncbi:MAG: hypothetical protein Q4D56_06190 [Bacteroides sp.]|nr:hypothetical protein [Bacteroides sp.]